MVKDDLFKEKDLDYLKSGFIPENKVKELREINDAGKLEEFIENKIDSIKIPTNNPCNIFF